MLAMKVDVDIVRRDLFIGEKIAVVDEAGRIERKRAQQTRLARRPAFVHEFVTNLRKTRRVNHAVITLAYREQETADALHLRRYGIEHVGPQFRHRRSFINAIDK
jgi:hypothetical protein